MDTYKVKVEVELPEQFFRDIMVTMVESGHDCVWYWGVASNIVRDHETKDVESFHLREDEASVTETRAAATITPKGIARAIQRCLDGHVGLNTGLKGYLYRAVTEVDAGDVDATIADVLAQVVLFDEVVYG